MVFRKDQKKKKGKEKPPEPVGGFAFVLSFLSLLPLIFACAAWVFYYSAESNLERLTAWLSGLGVGILIASYILIGHLSVFIHELKHSLVSNFVGNKWKGMKVDADSGHFEYAYYKSTSHFNAFINLAPYCLPVGTIVCSLLSLALFPFGDRIRLLVVGIGYGMDLILNVRDISPHQSDFYLIRGGFSVALMYVIVANLAVLSVLLVWVLFGYEGYLALIEKIVELCFYLVRGMTGKV